MYCTPSFRNLARFIHVQVFLCLLCRRLPAKNDD